MVQFDSFVGRLHRKELPLTDNYAIQLKSTIHELESEVDSLERQMSVFEAIWRNLHRRLGDSRTALALHRAVLAPIHRLPQELLVAVFQHCVAPDIEDLGSLSLGDDVRWTLLRVCRSWRCVLQGTPTLWTNLVIFPDTRSLIPALKLHLSFSSQHPLCVTVCEDEGDGEEPDLQFKDYPCPSFWEVLCSTTHRWQRLEINCFLTPVDTIIMDRMPLELPILEEVYLITRDIEADPRGPSGQERSWFKHAPRLKRATLNFVEDQNDAWYPPSLTHMCSKLQGNGSALEYALSLPNLQELVFLWEDYIMPLPSLHHNNLTYLRTSGTTLRSLTLPSLKCLALENHEYGRLTIPWVDDITAFIHRSKCRLTGLRIVEPSILEDVLTHTELFALLAPTLVMLGLVSEGTSDSYFEEFIRSLTRTESSPGYLPHLTHLNVSVNTRVRRVRLDGPGDVNSFVNTLTTALISLRDESLAEQWHAPLLAQVSVHSDHDSLVAKMRASCLDSLFSRGVKVAYGEYYDSFWMFTARVPPWYDTNM